MESITQITEVVYSSGQAFALAVFGAILALILTTWLTR